MNRKQYNSVIDWTLQQEQSEDSLTTARAVCNNLGVALPEGDLPQVAETLQSNDYMYWRSCTMQEAQAAANNGTAAIGVNEERIVVLSAADEEQPVTETAAVMTLSENTSAYAVDGLRYYVYGGGTTTCQNSFSCLTQEQKHFLSVIAGEAIGANARTWKGVAHTIMNRFKEPRDVWSNATSVTEVLVKAQYNAVGGSQYNKCMAYLNNRDGDNESYEELIQAVIPIYLGCEADFTGGSHYVFNVETTSGAAFENQLRMEPNRYVKRGPFAGISDTKYRMYRCLW